MKSAHVFFTGRVQGVGFRFTANRYADVAGITGLVRNMPNGSVELIAEHFDRDEIIEFIQRLRSNFNCEASIDWSSSPKYFTSFDISYSFGNF